MHRYRVYAAVWLVAAVALLGQSVSEVLPAVALGRLPVAESDNPGVLFGAICGTGWPSGARIADTWYVRCADGRVTTCVVTPDNTILC